MARVALLIGTEDYGTAFARLQATPRNVYRLADVLGQWLWKGHWGLKGFYGGSAR